MTGSQLPIAFVLGLSLFLWSCAQSSDPTPPFPQRGKVLWYADQETGDLSQWTAGNGGGAFNTASGTVTAELVDNAHSGQYVISLQIDNDDGAAHGARLFRWTESPRRGFYSAYLFFERPHPDADWWNVMQFKSIDALGESQPVWTVNVGTGSYGEMRLYLWDALDAVSHPSSTAREDAIVPVGEWIHVELYLEQATDTTGRIALWQDGVLLYDLHDEATAISDEVQWSLNNYTETGTNGVLTVLADDAEIRDSVPQGDD